MHKTLTFKTSIPHCEIIKEISKNLKYNHQNVLEYLISLHQNQTIDTIFQDNVLEHNESLRQEIQDKGKEISKLKANIDKLRSRVNELQPSNELKEDRLKVKWFDFYEREIAKHINIDGNVPEEILVIIMEGVQVLTQKKKEQEKEKYGSYNKHTTYRHG